MTHPALGVHVRSECETHVFVHLAERKRIAARREALAPGENRFKLGAVQPTFYCDSSRTLLQREGRKDSRRAFLMVGINSEFLNRFDFTRSNLFHDSIRYPFRQWFASPVCTRSATTRLWAESTRQIGNNIISIFYIFLNACFAVRLHQHRRVNLYAANRRASSGRS